MAGFSDQVSLGHHGLISTDNKRVVLRAKISGLEDLPPDKREARINQMYWRGTVYDTYVDGRWLRSLQPENRTPLIRQERGDTRRVFVGNLAQVRGPRARNWVIPKLLRQDIQLVGLDHPVTFALDLPLAFDLSPPPFGSWRRLDLEPRFGGETRLRPYRYNAKGREVPIHNFAGARYTAYSLPNPVGVNLLTQRSQGRGPSGGPNNPVDVHPSYRQLPPNFPASVRALAQKILKDDSGKTPNAEQAAAAVVNWLQETHSYTTNLSRNDDIEEPIEDFLLHQDAGHCEYFASASALLLRAAGIPTRYVNGFLGGEWNDIAGRVTVRDARAHSWIEYFNPTLGWQRLDATPSAAVGAPSMNRLAQMIDALELFWSQWVIHFDASRQLSLAKSAGKTFGFGPRQVGGPRKKRDTSWVGVVVLVMGTLGMGWFMWRKILAPRLSRTGSVRGGPGRQADALTALVVAMDGHFADAGYPRQETETLRDFATRVAHLDHPLERVARHIRAQVERTRYASTPPERAKLDFLARRLAKSLETPVPPPTKADAPDGGRVWHQGASPDDTSSAA